jgi:hypothetical protein
VHRRCPELRQLHCRRTRSKPITPVYGVVAPGGTRLVAISARQPPFLATP